jgi:hypothetical protein
VEEPVPSPRHESSPLPVDQTGCGHRLALGLAAPNGDGRPKLAARELVSLYATEGRRIFSQPLRKRLLDWIPGPDEVDNVSTRSTPRADSRPCSTSASARRG